MENLLVTCGEAAKLQAPGTLIFWRPPEEDGATKLPIETDFQTTEQQMEAFEQNGVPHEIPVSDKCRSDNDPAYVMVE